MLHVQNLAVFVQEKQVLKNINLVIDAGQLHILMGPNGSGKSSLVYALMNHPAYQQSGSLFFKGEDISSLFADARARKGLFLAAQYQYAIPGVTVFNFLREAKQALGGAGDVAEFYDMVCDTMDLLGMDQSFLHRYLNDGFSGGEKKRFEMLQMLLFNPRLIMLDEIDSGLDIEGVVLLQEAIELVREQNPQSSFLIITHNPDIAQKLHPTHLHILKDGSFVAAGDQSLLATVKLQGYDGF